MRNVYGFVVVALVAGLPLTSPAQTFKVLHDFGTGADGDNPFYKLLYQDGQLYGTTAFGGLKDTGVVFGFDLSTSTETVITNFSRTSIGRDAASGLAFFHGSLYGTDYGSKAYPGGAVYKINPRSKHGSAVAGFTDQFVEPNTLTTIGNMLYGTTNYGGASGAGSLFSFNPATRVITTLYSFGSKGGDTNPGDALTYANGVLYGITYGNNSVFAYNIATGVESTLATLDEAPVHGVIYQGGYLYGGAFTSGNDNGEIYRVDPASGTMTVLYKFLGGSGDGRQPSSALTYAADVLYGTTYAGGSASGGTIFAYNIAANAERILHSFQGAEASGYGQFSLIWVAGSLYGTGEGGGAHSLGYLFSLTP